MTLLGPRVDSVDLGQESVPGRPYVNDHRKHLAHDALLVDEVRGGSIVPQRFLTFHVRDNIEAWPSKRAAIFPASSTDLSSWETAITTVSRFSNSPYTVCS
jgi:hypothetical protein